MGSGGRRNEGREFLPLFRAGGGQKTHPLLTPTKIKQKKACENKNNKKITDWIIGNYDTEVREKLGKSEGRQLVSVGDKGGALTLALEWGGTGTLSEVIRD